MENKEKVKQTNNYSKWTMSDPLVAVTYYFTFNWPPK